MADVPADWEVVSPAADSSDAATEVPGESADVAAAEVAAAEPPADDGPRVQESIAVCIDRSGSMGTPFAEVVLNVVKGARLERTRMEAVKAMFYAFRDRAESISSGGHEMGLIQFDDVVERLLDLTPELDRFEAVVDNMAKRGQTAIFSAIVEGAAMLEERFREDRRTDLRVLVLTDGQNNAGAPASEALAAVNRIGAVVDAILVGNRPDANLRKIVSATGGECYHINDLGDGFELLEAESVVSLRARRGGAEKPLFQERPHVDLTSMEEKPITAKRRVAELGPAATPTAVVSVASLDADQARCGGAAVKRILKELSQVASSNDAVWAHSGEGVHIFPAPDNVKVWRALLEGPAGTPFEGGVFSLSVTMPDDYPFKPPKITFQTPVYHCNVSDSGSICLDLLKESWSPQLTVPRVLETIRTLLREPDTDNALRQWIAELTIAWRTSGGTDTRYFDKARELTRKEAATTVAEWCQLWGC